MDLKPESPIFNALAQAAAEFGTPVYVYDQDVIRNRCASLLDCVNFPRKRMLYAMKANSNPLVLKTILDSGFGVDCVSYGEMLLAKKLGSPFILFTNNNVADEEFALAVKFSRENTGVWINCDSLTRLETLPEGTACFVRINGPVGGGHHGHVITGGPESKFGIPWELTPQIVATAAKRNIRIAGVHQHIGSGIRDVSKFAEAMDVLLSVLRQHDLPGLEFVNFGGGIGVPYRPTDVPIDLKAFGAELGRRFEAFCKESGRDLTLMIEPGRFPVAESGYLVARVNTIKETPYGRTFAGIDTGFNHLVRPTMYGSYHHITNLSNPNGVRSEYYVAGNICESGDIFTRGDGEENTSAPRLLPQIRRGDLIALHNAGAYGYVMASEYNMRPRPPEVLFSGGKLVAARKAKTFQTIVDEALAV